MEIQTGKRKRNELSSSSSLKTRKTDVGARLCRSFWRDNEHLLNLFPLDIWKVIIAFLAPKDRYAMSATCFMLRYLCPEKTFSVKHLRLVKTIKISRKCITHVLKMSDEYVVVATSFAVYVYNFTKSQNFLHKWRLFYRPIKFCVVNKEEIACVYSNASGVDIFNIYRRGHDETVLRSSWFDYCSAVSENTFVCSTFFCPSTTITFVENRVPSALAFSSIRSRVAGTVAAGNVLYIVGSGIIRTFDLTTKQPSRWFYSSSTYYCPLNELSFWDNFLFATCRCDAEENPNGFHTSITDISECVVRFPLLNFLTNYVNFDVRITDETDTYFVFVASNGSEYVINKKKYESLMEAVHHSTRNCCFSLTKNDKVLIDAGLEDGSLLIYSSKYPRLVKQSDAFKAKKNWPIQTLTNKFPELETAQVPPAADSL